MKLWLLAAGFLSMAGMAFACSEDEVRIAGQFGDARFRISVADDPAEQAKGLMFVDQMSTLEGMLFIYDQTSPKSFWMKNTLIPLDMLFVGQDGRILNIHPNAQPLDETPVSSVYPVSHVLEINGGLSDRLGIQVGDALQHPSFGEDAILPCGEKAEG